MTDKSKARVQNSGQKPKRFQVLRGMRDMLPAEAARLQYAIDVCRKVFERYGFQPLFTPAMEPFELLAAKSGEGATKSTILKISRTAISAFALI
jgi:histidyl-tRNA synthetase